MLYSNQETRGKIESPQRLFLCVLTDKENRQ